MTFFGRRLLSCGDLIENRTRVSVHFDEARTSRHSRLTRKFVESARVIGQTHRDETVASYVTREFCATGIRIYLLHLTNQLALHLKFVRCANGNSKRYFYLVARPCNLVLSLFSWSVLRASLCRSSFDFCAVINHRVRDTRLHK